MLGEIFIEPVREVFTLMGSVKDLAPPPECDYPLSHLDTNNILIFYFQCIGSQLGVDPGPSLRPSYSRFYVSRRRSLHGLGQCCYYGTLIANSQPPYPSS